MSPAMPDLKMITCCRVAEDGSAVAAQQLASEWLGDDVAQVECSWVLLEVDGVDLLGTACHGVADGHPSGLVRDFAAACAVDEDAGISIDRGGA